MDLQQIEESLLRFSQSVPLMWYTFFGSIIEELIGIIPSPLVLTLAGSIALTNGKDIFYLCLLGLVASAGKTFAGWLLYVAADKAEDIVIGKFGKWLGVSHKAIESMGKRFGHGKRDDLTIFLTRAIPIFPSAVISLVCGAIRINIKTYLVATFLGNFVRSMIYIYLGYSGLEYTEKILESLDTSKSWISLVILIAGGIFGYWYLRKLRDSQE